MIKILLCSALLFAATAAQAVPITVNPGLFGGEWRVDTGVFQNGAATVDVGVGNHHMLIGGTSNNNIFFSVSADGTVTSQNTVAAAGGLGVLTFNTVPVQVNPAAYLGAWRINRVTWNSATNTFREVEGVQTLNLIPTLSYRIQIAANGNAIFDFDLASDGAVNSNNPTAATGGQGTLTFKNVSINVDTGLYSGTWGLSSVFTRYFHGGTYYGGGATYVGITSAGPVDIVVVPGMDYSLRVSMASDANSVLTLSVDANGNVASSRLTSVTTSGSQVSFITTPVVVNPQQYQGFWHIYHAANKLSGQQTVNLVADTPYWMRPNDIPNPNAGGSISIIVDTAGNVTSAWPASVVASGNILTFNNIAVNIDPGAYTGAWTLGAASGWGSKNGPLTLVLIPNWRYNIRLAGQTRPFDSYFTLDAVGNVTSVLPGSYSGDGTTNTLTFVTMPIVLDTGTYSGYLSFNEVYNVPGGPVTLAVVPGLHYRLFVNGGYNAPDFSIDTPCTVTGFPQVLTRSADTTTFDASGWSWSCPVVAVNNPPIADAGTGQNIYLGQIAYLNGAASSDPDADAITSYTWAFDSAPVGSAFAAPGITLTGVAPSFTPDLIGDYMLSLVVNDGALNSAAATVLITATQNLAPIATAISDVVTGDIPVAVSFDASASYDPEGGIVSYSWNFADPTTGVNNVSTLPNPIHTFNSVGTYIVLVDVIDDFGNVTQASVSIVVTDPVVVTPAPVTDPGAGTGAGNGLELMIHEAKVDYGKEGKVKGKVSVKAGFINANTPTADDRVSVSLDGVVLLDIPFSEFKAEDNGPGEFEYKGKKLKAKIDFNKSTIKVKRHKMVLSAIDNSDGVDVKISIGSLGGFENVVMKAKHGDEGERKLSYKNKQYDDD